MRALAEAIAKALPNYMTCCEAPVALPFGGRACQGALTQVKGGSGLKQRGCCGAAACSAAMRACVAHVYYLSFHQLKVSDNAAREAALPF